MDKLARFCDDYAWQITAALFSSTVLSVLGSAIGAFVQLRTLGLCLAVLSLVFMVSTVIFAAWQMDDFS